jgi:hypothetical protein
MRQYEIFRLKDLPIISQGGQRKVPRPVISLYHAARGEHHLGKITKAICRGIWYVLQADTSDSLRALILHSNGYNCLTFGTTSPFASLSTSNVSFVHLDDSRKLITSGPNHCSTKFVQPLPGGFVTPQTQNSVKPQSVGPIFLVCDVPHSTQPQTKWFSSAMKNCPSGDRRLLATTSTVQQAPTRLPGVASFASRANKSIRPSQLAKIFKTIIFRLKARLKFILGFRIVLSVHKPAYYMLWPLESTRYPRT